MNVCVVQVKSASDDEEEKLLSHIIRLDLSSS